MRLKKILRIRSVLVIATFACGGLLFAGGVFLEFFPETFAPLFTTKTQWHGLSICVLSLMLLQLMAANEGNRRLKKIIRFMSHDDEDVDDE